ncbi:hypothetical protein Tco_0696227 [Tanacetum coccineum]
MSQRVESSKDQEIDEAQEKQNDDLIFDLEVLEDDVMNVEAKVDGKDEQSTKTDDSTAGEAVTTAGDDSAVPITNGKFTCLNTYYRLSSINLKLLLLAATTATTYKHTRIKGWLFRCHRKNQISLDEQIARDIQAKLDAELLEEQKLARKQEEKANIALIES